MLSSVTKVNYGYWQVGTGRMYIVDPPVDGMGSRVFSGIAPAPYNEWTLKKHEHSSKDPWLASER